MTTQPPNSNSTRSRKREFPCTDAGNAEFFAERYKERLRYDHGRGRWLVWGGHWWLEDNIQAVLRWAKAAARARYTVALHVINEKIREAAMKWARQSESKYSLEATLGLAKVERPLSTMGKQWDTNPLLLGVGNGVVDLRTGRLRNGKVSDFISIQTDVEFSREATCPRWEQFMDEVFGGERELIEFVQRAVGYCLTGDVSEQVLFLCYGAGANGKSTFLETIRYVLGDYAYNLPFSAFELKARSAIPNEIAALSGKRFVTAIETNESVQLNEGRIKALTGRDPITGRFLYKEFFTFNPTGKFWLAFNHRPSVGDDSHGFWRRVRLIPFNQQFEEDRADPDLLPKLKGEATGILAWAIRGCLAWQKHGLSQPAQVELATREYREENDVVGEFLADRCVVSPDATVSTGTLWEAFSDWSAGNGSRWPLLDRKAFSARLKTRGFRQGRYGHGRTRIWLGLRLRTFNDDHPPLPPGNELRADADAKLPLLS